MAVDTFKVHNLSLWQKYPGSMVDRSQSHLKINFIKYHDRRRKIAINYFVQAKIVDDMTSVTIE